VGDFDITDTVVNFSVSGSLTEQAYVFASYGTLSGSPFDPGNISAPSALTNNYTLVYNHGDDQDEIAWVLNGGPSPAPAPGPLALIGLGALVWGTLRRWSATSKP
jgi:hypothetical protein